MLHYIIPNLNLRPGHKKSVSRPAAGGLDIPCWMPKVRRRRIGYSIIVSLRALRLCVRLNILVFGYGLSALSPLVILFFSRVITNITTDFKIGPFFNNPGNGPEMVQKRSSFGPVLVQKRSSFGPVLVQFWSRNGPVLVQFFQPFPKKQAIFDQNHIFQPPIPDNGPEMVQFFQPLPAYNCRHALKKI